MTRNTIRRVEVAAPVLDEKLKERLDWMFETMMNDDEKEKSLTASGNYVDRELNETKTELQGNYSMPWHTAMQKKAAAEEETIREKKSFLTIVKKSRLITVIFCAIGIRACPKKSFLQSARLLFCGTFLSLN